MCVNPRYYLAYGSNLNVDQMAYRCPDAVPLGPTKLKGWKLVFRGRRHGGVLNIERAKNRLVPAYVWMISPRDEKSLDRYEGAPHLYRKEMMEVEVDGKRVSAMVYIMNPRDDLTVNPPTESYYRGCASGTRTWDLDIRPIHNALRESYNEMGRGWE